MKIHYFQLLRPNYQLEHCITKREKKKRKFVMHWVKILLCSSLFFVYQGMVRTMKMSFTERKIYRVVLLKYWPNSLVLWRAVLSELSP